MHLLLFCPRYANRYSSTLPFVIAPISTFFFQIDLLLLFPFFLLHFSMLGFSPSCGSASFARPLGLFTPYFPKTHVSSIIWRNGCAMCSVSWVEFHGRVLNLKP